MKVTNRWIALAVGALSLTAVLPALAAEVKARAEASVGVKKQFEGEASAEVKGQVETKAEESGQEEAAAQPTPEEPAPAEEAPASLDLSDAPDGASVFVNGDPAGTTPLSEPILLEPGTHTIEVRKAGYQTIRTVLEAEPGAELVMNANLLPAARRAPHAPPIAAPERSYTPTFVPLGLAWYRTKRIALNPYIARAERIQVIALFLASYEMSGSMRKRATSWKTALERGYEPESFRDPDYMRTRPDLFAMRVYGGNYGGGLLIELPTGRWPWFYLGGRFTGGGGAPVYEYDDYRSWFAAGLHFGVPFSIGKRNLHEIRVGGAAMLGYIRDYLGYSDRTGLYEERFTVGPILAPEISYVVHLARRFALQFGADAYFGIVKGVPYGSSDEKRPRAMISGFIGFRI